MRSLFFCLGLAAAVMMPWRDARAAPGECTALAGKRIRWIVPNSPGGGYDTYSRLITPFLAEELDAEIVVVNMPGAGGILGANRIKTAPPDGLTLGILNGPGMLIAGLIGEKEAPDILEDFTVLGRIARSRHVWAAAGDSTFRTFEDALSAARERPLLFAIDEVASSSFVSATLGASLLPAQVEFLSGFSGSRQTTMAVIRGDADLVSQSFESILGSIEGGDLRPILQFSTEPIANHPSLKGVPLIGGETGLATEYASARGAPSGGAAADAEAMVALLGVGRLVVAPGGLSQEILTCLEGGLHEALEKKAFREAAAKAGRSLRTAPAGEAEKELHLIRARSGAFLSLLRESMEKARR